MANSLNIDTSKFGFDDNYMFLHDPAMYIDLHDGAGLLSLGYLEAEKTWRQTVEYAMFKTNIPKTEIRRDIISQEFTIEGTLKQLQPETMALIMQRRYDDTDASWNRVIIGSEVPAAVFPSCVLIGKTVDGNELRLYIRRLQITAEDLEILLGGDDYAGLPFKGTAQKDTAPLTTNADWPYNPSYADQDNIAFWAWPRAGASS
jgi:hypothetical protein